MPFDPDEFLAEKPTATQPVAAQVQFNPDDFLSSSDAENENVIKGLLDDDKYDEIANGAAHEPGSPEREVAKRVYIARNKQSVLDKAKKIKPTDVLDGAKHAAGGLLDFGRGIFETPYRGIERIVLGVAGRAAKALGDKEAEDTFAKAQTTSKARSALAGQSIIEGLKHTAINLGGGTVNNLPYDQTHDEEGNLLYTPEEEKAATDALNDDLLGRDFDTLVESHRNQQEIHAGNIPKNSAVASLMRATGDDPANYSAQELEDIGAKKVDPEEVAREASAGNPENLALAVAPQLPYTRYLGGAATKAAGNIMRFPQWAIHNAPHGLKRSGYIGKVAALGGGAELAHLAVTHPVVAAKIAAGAAALETSGMLGRALRHQGEEAMTEIPSKLSKRVAEGRVKAARGGGLKALDVNAEAGKYVGDSAVTAASGAIGFIPINAALSGGDPKQFMDMEIGAMAFGAGLHSIHASHPAMVEAARPYLRKDGASRIDTNSKYGQQTKEFMDSLPEDQKNSLLETMGALGGAVGESEAGERSPIAIHVLSDKNYAQAVADQHGGQVTADAGGNGFFKTESGQVFVNGEGSHPTYTTGHEAGGHAAINVLRAMGSKGMPVMDAMLSAARKGLYKEDGATPTDEFKAFIDSYNKAFDPTGQTKAIDASNPASVEEWISEEAGVQVAREGAAKFAVPKTIADKIQDGIGRFGSRFLGVNPDLHPLPFDRTEVQAITDAVRKTLVAVAQAPRAEAPDASNLPAGSSGAPDPLNPSGKPAQVNVATAPASPEQSAAERQTVPMIVATFGGNAKDAQVAIDAVQAEATAPITDPVELYKAVAARAQRLKDESKALDDAERAKRAEIEAAAQKAAAEKAAKGLSSVKPPATSPETTAPLSNIRPNAQSPTQETSQESNTATVTAEGVERPVTDRVETPGTEPKPVAAAPSDAEISTALTKADETAAPKMVRAKSPERREEIKKEARLDALKALLPKDGDGLRVVVDDVTRETSYEGDIDSSNRLHRAILNELGVTPEQEAVILDLQSKKGKGVVLRDYNSAEQEGFETGEGIDLSNVKRKNELSESPADERGASGAPVSIQDKGFTPYRTVITKSGKVVTLGFDHDKFLDNTRKVLDAAKANGEKTGFEGLVGADLDKAISKTFRNIAANHANGRAGTGRELKGIQANPDRAGIPVSQDRVNTINMAMHNRQARPPKEAGKTDLSKLRFIKKNDASKEAIGLADRNKGFLDPLFGETNKLRSNLEAKGFKTDQQLKPVISNIRPDLIGGGIHETPGSGKSVHASGLDIPAPEFTSAGVPRAKQVAAGFQPKTDIPVRESKRDITKKGWEVVHKDRREFGVEVLHDGNFQTEKQTKEEGVKYASDRSGFPARHPAAWTFTEPTGFDDLVGKPTITGDGMWRTRAWKSNDGRFVIEENYAPSGSGLYYAIRPSNIASEDAVKHMEGFEVRKILAQSSATKKSKPGNHLASLDLLDNFLKSPAKIDGDFSEYIPSFIGKDGVQIGVGEGLGYHDSSIDPGSFETSGVSGLNSDALVGRTGAIKIVTSGSVAALSDYGDGALGIVVSRNHPPTSSQRSQIGKYINAESGEGDAYSRVGVDIAETDGSLTASQIFDGPEKSVGRIMRWIEENTKKPDAKFQPKSGMPEDWKPDELVFKKQTPTAKNVIAHLGPDAFVSYRQKYKSDPSIVGVPEEGETSIVMNMGDDQPRRHYILDGDHREAYAQAFKAGGQEAVMKKFSELEPEFGSVWSHGADSKKGGEMVKEKSGGDLRKVAKDIERLVGDSERSDKMHAANPVSPKLAGLGEGGTDEAGKPTLEGVRRIKSNQPLFQPKSDLSKVTSSIKSKRGTGKDFAGFFSGVSRGEKGVSNVPFKPIMDLKGHEDAYTELDKHTGNFDEHIAKSIPGYKDVQIKKIDALANVFPDGAEMLDLGGSEGSFAKAITARSGGKVKTTVLDPNPDMASFFREKSKVPGSTYDERAFIRGWEEGDKTIPAFDPAVESKKFDIVHEAMVFQFINNDRAEQIAAVKKAMNPDGLFVTEEKVTTPEWAENELKKDRDFKDQYFTKEQLAEKQKEVGFTQDKGDEKAVGMVDNMTSQKELEKVLGDNFKHVVQYWDSGNFKGYAASDDAAVIKRFTDKVGDTSSDFATKETPSDVKFQPKSDLSKVKSKKEESYKLKTQRDGVSKAWVQPDGKIIPLKGWHAEYLNQNAEEAKRLGLKNAEEITDSTEDKAKALDAGYGRINLRDGTLIAEFSKSKFNAQAKESLRKLIEDNIGDITRVDISLFSKGGKNIIGGEEANVFRKMDKVDAMDIFAGEAGTHSQASDNLLRKSGAYGQMFDPPRFQPKATIPSDAEVKIGGKKVKTGTPVTFEFRRGTASATKEWGIPDKDSAFDRGYEPSGEYMIERPAVAYDPTPDQQIPNTKFGITSFENPIVIDAGNYGEASSWKRTLSEAFGGKTGKNLSKAIIADGYDGIITVETDRRGNKYTGEIVDLTTFDERKAKYQPKAAITPQEKRRTRDMIAQSAWFARKAAEAGKKLTPEMAVDFGEKWRKLHPHESDETHGLPDGYLEQNALRSLEEHRADAERSRDALLEQEPDATTEQRSRAALEGLVAEAKKAGRVFGSEVRKLKADEGVEHEVLLLPGRVLKITHPHSFGGVQKMSDIWVPQIHPADAADYLKRIELANKTFGDDIRVEGVVDNGNGDYSIVASQPNVKGRKATTKEIQNTMEEEGFVQVVPNGYYHPEKNIYASDVRGDNVVHTPDGEAVLDAMMTEPDAQMREWMTKRIQQIEDRPDIKKFFDEELPLRDASFQPKSDLSKVRKYDPNEDEIRRAVSLGGAKDALSEENPKDVRIEVFGRDGEAVGVALEQAELDTILGSMEKPETAKFEAVESKPVIQERWTKFQPKSDLASIGSKKRPVDDNGLFSELRANADEKLPNKASAEQIKATLNKSGAKKEELEYSGINEWLDSKTGPVTKQEVLEYLDAHNVSIKEVKKGALDQDTKDEMRKLSRDADERQYELDQHIDESNSRDWKDDEAAMEADSRYIRQERDAIHAMREEVRSLKSGGAETKYEDRALPGGENYKERLFTLPAEPNRPMLFDEFLQDRGISQSEYAAESQEGRAAIQRVYNDHLKEGMIATKPAKSIFTSPHWSEPNVVLHTRESDHSTGDARKGTLEDVRLIEEIQSDWHQEGRKTGYKGDVTKEELEAAKLAVKEAEEKMTSGPSEGKEAGDNAAAYREAKKKLNRLNAVYDGVAGAPQAPFKRSWHELGFKVALDKAIKDGKKWLAWTTGKQQIDRYEEALRQNVDQIDWITQSGDEVLISATKGDASVFAGRLGKDGRFFNSINKVNGKTAEDVFGKEIAAKIAEKETGQLKGDNLAVGGEGMKGFYDDMLGTIAKKFAKKYGSEVKDIELNNNPEEISGIYSTQLGDYEIQDGDFNRVGGTYKTYAEAKAAVEKMKSGDVVHALRITPEMAEAIKSGGQPMFQPKISRDAAEEIRKISDPENHPDSFGVTLNSNGTINKDTTGDVVTLASENVPLAKLTQEKVEDFITRHQDIADEIDIKPGVFRLERKPGSASIDLNVIVPREYRDNTRKFAESNNQESFFSLDDMDVVDTGGTGDTKLKDHQDIVDAAKSLIEGKPYFQPKTDLSSIKSKEQDARYLELAKEPEKNREELQRMVDEAAIKKSGSPFVESQSVQTQRIYVTKTANKSIEYNQRRISDLPTDEQVRAQYSIDRKAWTDAVKDPSNVDEVLDAIHRGIKPTGFTVEDAIRQRDMEREGAEKEIRIAQAWKDRTPEGPEATHFQTGQPFITKAFHSTPFGRLETFDDQMLGGFTGAPSAKMAHFFAGSKRVAETYFADNAWLLQQMGFLKLDGNQKRELVSAVHEELGKNPTNEEVAHLAESLFDTEYDSSPIQNETHEVFVTLKNPLVHDFQGEGYRDTSYRELLERAEMEGRDGVVMANTYDAGPAAHMDDSGPSTNVIAVLRGHSSQIKSADPITRDAEGRVIPLSQRFNPESLDIRFQPKSDLSSIKSKTPELKLGKAFSRETAIQTGVKMRQQKQADRFPEAIPVEYKRENGKFITDEKGRPEPHPQSYDLYNTPLAKQAAKGIRGEEARDRAVATAYADKLHEEYKRVQDDPEIMSGGDWYKLARTKIKNLFGDDTVLFAQLLGATSARTPAEENYHQAIEAYNAIRSGKYDGLAKRYISLRDKLEAGEDIRFRKTYRSVSNGNVTSIEAGEKVTPSNFKSYLDSEDITPRKDNGKKFNANSLQVLQVIAGTWEAEVGGPKTPNFAGNLSGKTLEATIDVWAARGLHRLGNKGNKGRWRLLPESEKGVEDKDFFLGQKAYREAAERIGINPDDLQGILWFAEKREWEKNGWTRGTGAELADFNTYLGRTINEAGIMKVKRPGDTESIFGDLSNMVMPKKLTKQEEYENLMKVKKP